MIKSWHLLMLILTSCQIDPQTFPEYVTKAAKAVNHAFGRDVLTPGFGTTISITQLSPGIGGTTRCFPYHCDLQVNSDVTVTDIVPVLLHEFGHTLGLKHTADPNDVMYEYVPRHVSVEKLAQDLVVDCEIQGCEKTQTYYISKQ